MPKAAGSGINKLTVLIAEIEAETYPRGKADARKEVLDLLAAGGARAAGAKRMRETGRRKRRSPSVGPPGASARRGARFGGLILATPPSRLTSSSSLSVR